MTIPDIFFTDYSVEIDDATVEELEIKDTAKVIIYTIITIPNGSVRLMTTNLLAPIIFNTENMSAKQIVMDKSNYTTKHRLFPDKKD